MTSTRIDEKGRISIPSDIRNRLGLESGDVIFLNINFDEHIIQLAKADNPFDALADEALAEHRAGKTISLRDYARSEGIDLNVE